MFSDLMTFIQTLPLQSLQSGSFLPDSFQGSSIPIDSMENLATNLDSTYKMVVAVISLVFALAGCFFGYKLSKIFMSITGFVLGACLGYLVATQLIHTSGTLTTICIIAGGIIMAFMAYWIYRVGIFILCFALAFVASASLLPLTGDIQFFVCTILGFVVGSFALKFIRPVIIITSAVVCGTSAAGLIITVSKYFDVTVFSSMTTSAGLAVIVSALGILIQFLTTKEPELVKKKKKE